MDRSLKWRTFGLAGIVLLCFYILIPSASEFGITEGDTLPDWIPHRLRPNKVNLGLDLQGGTHIVYSIDLDKAVDDKAGDLKRELESRYADDEALKTKPTVKNPAVPLGAVTVIYPDVKLRAADIDKIKADFKGIIETRDECPDGANAYCFKVSSTYADGVKKSALANAVNTIRERIDEKGVAEPSVVQKDDQIIVELPGLDEEKKQQTRDIIARTAKLEFKVVDNNSDFMRKLYGYVGNEGKEGKPTEPRALREGIYAEIDQWRPDDGGQLQTDYYLIAHDRKESMTVEDAKKIECVNRTGKPVDPNARVVNGKIECNVSGRAVIARYLDDLAKSEPEKWKLPDDRQVGYELVEPRDDAKDKRTFWRTYYLERAVRLTGTTISNAMGSYDPNTNRPIVLLDFNRYGGRIFGDLTAEITGKKLATILDDKVKSAPIINGAIRGGRASITMGGSEPRRQEIERDELVNVLKTGSLPAPLKEESVSDVGPTLGRDAIHKTKLSFIMGAILVLLIMVGIYRWSGWIAVFAVLFHTLMTLSVMALFGATLTLPGIAAIVLSLGMCVDGNILIYERIRDELRLGKSVRGAVDLGFSRAFSAILDGQLTTAAGGWVLLQYGSGPIKGFAVMLLVGVFTTVTTNTWVTRVFFDWYTRKKGQAGTISI